MSAAAGAGRPPPARRVLSCPACGVRHVDQGKWATFAHARHLCYACGRFFEDPLGPSIGVDPVPPA